MGESSKPPAWTSKLPDVKVQPTTPAPEATTTVKAEAPLPPKMHLMTIHNGDAIRRVRFPVGDEEAEPIIDIQRNSPEREPASGRTALPNPSIPTTAVAEDPKIMSRLLSDELFREM